MKVKTAKEILTRAKKDEIFDGEIPDDDSELLEKASEIVTLAEQAWESHVRGPEVEAILNLAKADQNGGAPEKSKPKAKAEKTNDEESEVKSVSAFEDLDEELAKSAPWDGYVDLTVEEVTEGINWFGENSPDDILDILKNVWAFESTHKDRSRILNFVKEAYVKFGGELGTEEEEESQAEEEEAEEEAEGDESVSESDGSEILDEDTQVVSEETGEVEDVDEPESNAGDDSEPEASEESGKGSSGKAEPTGKNSEKGSGGSSGGSSAEAKLVKLAENELKRERLDGVPKRPEHEAPSLPWKWSDISDQQLHDLHMQYASLAYYKSYQRARDERIALHCKEAADEIRNKLLVEAPKYDEKNKPITVTFVEAQINSDPSVRRWRKMQSKYERFAVQAKHEMESLHKVVEALSRLMTVRHEAWERSRK